MEDISWFAKNKNMQPGCSIVCNCNTFDEGPKVEISNKSTECWSTVTNFSFSKNPVCEKSSRVEEM